MEGQIVVGHEGVYHLPKELNRHLLAYPTASHYVIEPAKKSEKEIKRSDMCASEFLSRIDYADQRRSRYQPSNKNER